MKIKNLLRILSYSLIVLLSFMSCATDDDPTEELIISDYDISGILTKFSGTGLDYVIEGNFVTFTTENLPNHSSPYWPTTNALYEAYTGSNSSWNKNPNEISPQNIVFKIPLYPTEAINKSATSLGPIGISRNGVVFFNQYAAGNSPLSNEINSFDQWLGHPQNFGTYHYHIEPTYLTDNFGEDAFLGLLADGFPVYGPIENGNRITNTDLDMYHGHTTITPDFPEGIYHYHITSEDPYLNGSGYFGTPGNISQ